MKHWQLLLLPFLSFVGAVNVLYRRAPNSGSSDEPQRLQLSTDDVVSAPAEGGWISIGPIAVDIDAVCHCTVSTVKPAPTTAAQSAPTTAAQDHAEHRPLEASTAASSSGANNMAGGEQVVDVDLEAVEYNNTAHAFRDDSAELLHDADCSFADHADSDDLESQALIAVAQEPKQLQLVPYLQETSTVGRSDWEVVSKFPRHGSHAEPERLRQAASRLLETEGEPCGSPANSGKFAVIAFCNRCILGCTKRYRFSFCDAWQVLMQKRGAHKKTDAVQYSAISEPVLKRIRLDVARKYSQLTPSRAVTQMENDKVPVAHQPSTRQLETMRRPEDSGPDPYPTELIGLLEAFVNQPPPQIHVFSDHVVISATEIRIPFTSSLMWERCSEFVHLPVFLMDYTFNTNKHGLVLGVCGPCGLHCDAKDKLPHVRLIPMVFCICIHEDSKAHSILLTIFEEIRARCPEAVPLSDAVMDFACLQSAATHFQGRQVYLHRCLQHVMTDLDKESNRRDPATGLPRLRKTELLKVFKPWVQWIAFLPNDIEAHAFCKEAFDRMEHEVLDTDFKEKHFAEYLKQHIFDIGGDSIIRCQFASGLGAMPLGYTTWAANSMERLAAVHSVVLVLQMLGFPNHLYKSQFSRRKMDPMINPS